MRYALFAGMIAAGLVGLTAGANAVPVGIDTNPTIVDGDKTFTTFTCSVTGGQGQIRCADMTVVAYTNPGGELGLQFQAPLTSAFGIVDLLISYNATTSGGQLFHDATLAYNGTPISNVTETIYDSFGNVLGQLSVDNPPPVLSDNILLDHDVGFIHVVKDILLATRIECTGPCPAASISFIDQNFSQTQVPVPEPGSLALLGVALTGLGILRRRKSAS